MREDLAKSFFLVHKHMQQSSSLFTGSPSNRRFVRNVMALQREVYLRYGIISSPSVLQGSPGPVMFAAPIVGYIMYGTLSWGCWRRFDYNHSPRSWDRWNSHLSSKVELGHVLQFVTGCPASPATGFDINLTIVFDHEETQRKLSANTCSRTLNIPVCDLLASYESFKSEFPECIFSLPGFGRVWIK